MPPQEFVHYENHKIIVNLIKNKFTGCITMTPKNRKLFFDRGSLVYAHSDVVKETFSTILCEMGVLEPEKLEQIKSQLEPGQSLGKKLRMLGCADAHSLAVALKQQIMRIVNRCVNLKEGAYEVLPGELPGRIPKLKIRTLPLFIKSFLMIENPTFPEHVTDDLVFERTESFDVLVDELNLPANYFEALDLMGSSRTLQEIDEVTDLDPFQIRRLAYSLSLLKMGVLRERQTTHQQAPIFVAPDLPVEAQPLEPSDEEPLDLVTSGDDAGVRQAKEASQDLVIAMESVDEQPHDETGEPVRQGLEEDGDSVEGPLDIERMIPLDRSIDEPLADLTALADILARPGREQPDKPKALDDLENSHVVAPDAAPQQDASIDAEPLEEAGAEAVEEADEGREDPVEALNRALNQSEILAKSEQGFDVPEFDDDHATVPGSPVPQDLMKQPGRQTEEPYEEALSDYEPEDVFEEDAALTAPVPLSEIPHIETPEEEAPPVRVGTDRVDSGSLEEMGFILPDREDREEPAKPRPNARRTWIWLPIAALVLATVGGVVFKDIWWPQVANLLGLAGSQKDVEISPDAPIQVTDLSESVAVEDEASMELAQTGPVETEPDGPTPEPDTPDSSASMESPAQSEATAPESRAESLPVAQAEAPDRPSEPGPASQEPAETAQTVASPMEDEEPEAATPRYVYETLARESVAALRDRSGRYSIAFIVACETETLDAFFNGRSDPELRLLPRKIKNRDCFIGIWGIFESREAAQKALPSIPNFIRHSGDRPWILDLAQYL